jgi:hypothetical protein
MTPYLSERLARDRMAEMVRQAQERRLAAQFARPWLPPIDIQLRLELRVSTRRPTPAGNS